MISYVLPTRNRPTALARTLAAIGRLDDEVHDDGAEVIVVDNASSPPAAVPARLANAVPVHLVRRPRNDGAAARNAGVERARNHWIVMLDDDSHPLDAGVIDAIRAAPGDVAAIGAEIVLPDGRREAGGLPEVFVGCGAAVRRAAFLDAVGYDASFGYYVEEYDLCAKLLLGGHRIAHDPRFRVRHEKLADDRDMDLILRRLVRNNGWVGERYAPAVCREAILRETLERYARIAVKEAATAGYAAGVAELLATIDAQPRRPMDRDLHDRFTGAAHVRRVLRRYGGLEGAAVVVVEPGKNAALVRRELEAHGARLVDDVGAADLLAIGTLSPGPMWDAAERWATSPVPLLGPWIESPLIVGGGGAKEQRSRGKEGEWGTPCAGVGGWSFAP